MKPSDLNKTIEKYLALRTRRLALDKQSEELKAEENLLKDLVTKEMMARVEKQGTLYQPPGAKFKVELKMTAEAQLADWDALQDHIRKTGEFDLLQKRVTVTAVRARWEVGKTVPGVVQTQVPTVTIGKVKE